MKKLPHLLPILLLLCRMGIAQTVRVIDKTTLQPLTGVAINSTSSTGSIRTNTRGRADISDITSPDRKLRFSYIGYQTGILTSAQLQQLNYEVALENLTDRYYRVFASCISAPGRNLMLTVRGRF
ncbi:hypothetical protein ACFS7Z_18315 [Pontibacter toksunensis]|uniref:TonB-dependent receptor n=1 Tax=Pontibacter toksunensis TaxID=1332631 RepID=A0ABW6BZJ7_9BACT